MWQTSNEHELKQFSLNQKSISDEKGRPLILAEFLQRTANRIPDHPAIMYQGKSYTYATLYCSAVALSKKLITSGIQKRDKIILIMENCPEFYVAYFGILQTGAIIAPTNALLTPQEVKHIVEDAEPKALFVHSHLMHLTKDLQKNLLIMTENDLSVSHEIKNIESLPIFTIPLLEFDEMTALLYTSGTTGKPKGVMLSSKNIVTNILQAITRFQLNSSDRLFCALPLFHSFAQNTCLWTSIACGSTVILIHKIDRHAIINGLKQKPTIFLGIPALYALLCLLKTASLESIRIFISGGDALPDKIRALFALLYRRIICNGYGMTEASPMIAGDVHGVLCATNTVGKPLIGISCSLKDDAGNDVKSGEIGELWIKGDNVMIGYYKAPELTKRVLQDGWLRTGDLAYCDPEGQIVISGRSKDLIIHKGLNIYPQEIENIILTHADVIHVGVVGKQSDDVGEWPVAFVQLRAMQDNIEKKLRSMCTEHLAIYKVPRNFYCSIKELPLTTTGKVDKKQLRALIETQDPESTEKKT